MKLSLSLMVRDRLPAAWQQEEQFVAGEIWVFDDPIFLLLAKLCVEVLHGWQRHSGELLSFKLRSVH